MKKRFNVISALLLGCLVSIIGCSAHSQADEAPFPIVHAKTLLLNASVFPATWQVDPCTPDCDRAERPAQALRTFGRIGLPGSAIQQIYVFADTRGARALFERDRDVEFAALSPPDETFVQPPAIAYRSPFASDAVLGCGKEKLRACKAFLRYRNYVIEFYFPLDTGQHNGMQLTDIEPVLRAMDNLISETFHPTATPLTAQPSG